MSAPALPDLPKSKEIRVDSSGMRVRPRVDTPGASGQTSPEVTAFMTDGAQAKSGRASTAPDPLMGRTIDERYTIRALIARGGMGKVYRAEQAPLGRPCAIKILQPSYSGEADPEFHRRFFLEASIASKLTHPNTVTIFDYGRTEDDVYYMAMEYLDGRTLHKAIREAGWFDEERTAHVARQICRSLREAHGLGVIHRDLKPANVFLTEHGDEVDFVKVLDFGLVKIVGEPTADGSSAPGRAALRTPMHAPLGDDQLTQTGLFMGSPKYMAPEQIQGEKVDGRTDVYSLGIMMYEMLCGKVPFDRSNSVNILMAHVHERPPTMHEMNPGVRISPAFEGLVMRCIAKNPDERPASMDEVLAQLKLFSGQAGGLGYTGEYMSGQMKVSTFPPPAMSSQPPQPQVISSRSSRRGLAGQSSGPIAAMGSQQIEAARPSASESLVRPRSTRGIYVAAILVASVGLLGVAGIVTIRNERAARATATATPTAIATATATSTPTVASPESPTRVVKVRLDSDPAGASVREGGVEICAATPCDVMYTGDDADPIKEHRLTFAKPGFRAETKSARVADGPLRVKLAHAPGAGAATPHGGRAGGPKPEASGDALKGFKEQPY
jgi:serine/threonine-protein kinase